MSFLALMEKLSEAIDKQKKKNYISSRLQRLVYKYISKERKKFLIQKMTFIYRELSALNQGKPAESRIKTSQNHITNQSSPFAPSIYRLVNHPIVSESHPLKSQIYILVSPIYTERRGLKSFPFILDAIEMFLQTFNCRR